MTTYISTHTRRLVRRRSGRRCEYCGFREASRYVPLHVDHIIAEQHGGRTEPGNLAFCCGRCNRHKGPNIATLDPLSGELVGLFHPRREKWAEHLEWDGVYVRGITPVGRGTLRLLKMNEPVRLLEREAADD